MAHKLHEYTKDDCGQKWGSPFIRDIGNVFFEPDVMNMEEYKGEFLFPALEDRLQNPQQKDYDAERLEWVMEKALDRCFSSAWWIVVERTITSWPSTIEILQRLLSSTARKRL